MSISTISNSVSVHLLLPLSQSTLPCFFTPIIYNFFSISHMSLHKCHYIIHVILYHFLLQKLIKKYIAIHFVHSILIYKRHQPKSVSSESEQDRNKYKCRSIQQDTIFGAVQWKLFPVTAVRHDFAEMWNIRQDPWKRWSAVLFTVIWQIRGLSGKYLAILNILRTGQVALM
jgi:hypothetical protein